MGLGLAGCLVLGEVELFLNLALPVAQLLVTLPLLEGAPTLVSSSVARLEQATLQPPASGLWSRTRRWYR